MQYLLPNLHEVDVIADLRVKLAGALDALLADRLLDLFVVVAAFLQWLVGPLLIPFPVGEGDESASALVLATWLGD